MRKFLQAKKEEPLAKALRRTFKTQPNLTMLGTGLMTLTFGLGLLRPGDTFATSTSFDILSKVSLSFFHPDEAGWGAIIACTGVAMLIGWWFLCRTQEIVETYETMQVNYPGEHWPNINIKTLPSYGYNRACWALGGALWFLLCGSFLLSNPLTTSLSAYGIFGVGSCVFNVIRLHYLVEQAGD